MITIIILAILIIISGGYLFYLIFRKLPDVKNLDISSIPDEKQVEARLKILESKFSRSSNETKERLSKIFSPTIKKSFSFFSDMKDRILSLEAHYKMRDKKLVVEKPKTIDELIKEGSELLNKEDYLLSEKSLIEVISRDSKNIKAYELLGELYFGNKSYDQAEEIYIYLIKLSAVNDSGGEGAKGKRLEDAENDLLDTVNVNIKIGTYYDDLAQIYEIVDKMDKSLDCYLKANMIEPNNPKYLDKIIELSIKLGDRSLAKKTLNRLRQINPENGKLKDMESAIENI
ncbi:MAG: hypothetical protein WC244_01530 [Patescibacteria group bacterium]|jgi:tetratricopeptide (TPR) repeat protein